ncbi:unnamed protein product [Rhizophagus irregularis]|nr:unnamed protein product [Rhizophagus irregularis]
MPNETFPLVSLSSGLANLKMRFWLNSALWCLSQVIYPFYNFHFTWTDLRKMSLVANTGKIPSWFQLITSIPNLTFYLPLQLGVISITPSLSFLVGKFIDIINTSSHIRL